MFTKDSRILNHRLTVPLTSVSNAVGDVFKPTFNQLIKSLSANGEQGFFYDPNDLSTMYQDAAGTIPVTGVGQPVGLMLDKSKGLVIGSSFVRNGDFSDGATSWVARANTQLSIVDGRLRVSAIASGLSYGVESTLVSATVASKRYRFSAEVYRTNTPNLVYARGASTTAQIRNTSFNSIELGGSSSLAFTASQYGVVAGEYFEIDNVSIKEIAGSYAYQTDSACKPKLQRNATTGAYYLEFDGSDDFLVTNNIDFTATDEVSLFAAVKNTSTILYQNIVELSASASETNGTFLLRCPQNPPYPLYLSRGTVAAQTGNLSTTPDLLAGVVLSSQSKISTDTLRLRVNGVLNSISTDQGAGNYGNYPIYIGRRGGASQPFGGHIYSLISVGRLTTESEIAAIEKELAKRTGVTLNV